MKYASTSTRGHKEGVWNFVRLQSEFVGETGEVGESHGT